jgi:hypothetical protein
MGEQTTQGPKEQRKPFSAIAPAPFQMPQTASPSSIQQNNQSPPAVVPANIAPSAQTFTATASAGMSQGLAINAELRAELAAGANRVHTVTNNVSNAALNSPQNVQERNPEKVKDITRTQSELETSYADLQDELKKPSSPENNAKVKELYNNFILQSLALTLLSRDMNVQTFEASQHTAEIKEWERRGWIALEITLGVGAAYALGWAAIAYLATTSTTVATVGTVGLAASGAAPQLNSAVQRLGPGITTALESEAPALARAGQTLTRVGQVLEIEAPAIQRAAPAVQRTAQAVLQMGKITSPTKLSEMGSRAKILLEAASKGSEDAIAFLESKGVSVPSEIIPGAGTAQLELSTEQRAFMAIQNGWTALANECEAFSVKIGPNTLRIGKEAFTEGIRKNLPNIISAIQQEFGGMQTVAIKGNQLITVGSNTFNVTFNAVTKTYSITGIVAP